MVLRTKKCLSNLIKIVSFHSALIKHLKTQINHLSAQTNQRAKGTFSSDTLPNPKNDVQSIAIVTKSGKILDDANIVPKKVANEKIDDWVKTSAPIRIVVVENPVHEKNVIVEEEEDESPNVEIDGEETKRDKSAKGDMPKCPSISSKVV